jgi:putative isomerase
VNCLPFCTAETMFKSILLSLVFLALQTTHPSEAWRGATSVNPLKSMIGEADYRGLITRLQSLNSDIATKGLHDFPDSDGKLLTGYAYGEYYDWDLYFENI